MTTLTRTMRHIIALVLNRGYLAPDHAVAVAGRILETTPLPDAFALLAAALLRHAAILDPFNRKTLMLAMEVNSKAQHRPFSIWSDTANRLTAAEPVPENISPPSGKGDTPKQYRDYLQAQPANAMRYPVMLRLWQSGDVDTFEYAVQTISASPSGLLCAPVMAWGAYFAGKPLLAELLLDEGVPNFIGKTLRARFAKGDERTGFIHAALEAEPFQPASLVALNTGTGLAHAHRELGKPLKPGDLSYDATLDLDSVHPHFIRSLETSLKTLPPSAADFWSELRPYLG